MSERVFDAANFRLESADFHCYGWRDKLSKAKTEIRTRFSGSLTDSRVSGFLSLREEDVGERYPRSILHYNESLDKVAAALNA